MPIKKLTVGLFAAFALAGCPTPPPSGGEGGPLAGGPPPGTEGGPPPGTEGAPGAGAPGEGLPPEGADEGPKGNAPDPADLPTFKDLIGEGPSITVTLNITGPASGQADFQVFIEKDGAKQPKVLHVEKYANNKLVVKAPANYEEPVYISVNGNGAPVESTSQPLDVSIGGVPDAVTFGSTDLVFDVVLGDEPPAWMGFPSRLDDDPPLGEGVEPSGPPPSP